MSGELKHDTRTPDIETSSESYATRFSGSVGEYFLRVQSESVLRLLSSVGPAMSLLEVGGGHGQLTSSLLSAGHRVCVQGSSAVCFERIKSEKSLADVDPRFVASNWWSLPFRDESFDVAVAVRLLAHVEDIEGCLREMARVSRRGVLVDFAPLMSANLLSPLMFHVKRRIEGNTRPFFVHRRRQLVGILRGLGFGHFEWIGQFFWPMGIHRAMNQVLVSRGLESVARGVGATRLFGSPMLMLATRG